jgi:hypothetical protein
MNDNTTTPQKSTLPDNLKKFWEEMPPSKAGMALYNLTFQELLRAGERYHNDKELSMFNNPGEVARVLEAAVRLVEIDQENEPAIDPYMVEDLTKGEFAERVIQGLLAWERLYAQKFGKQVRKSVLKTLEDVIIGLVTLTEMRDGLTEPCETPPTETVQELRTAYAETGTTETWG